MTGESTEKDDDFEIEIIDDAPTADKDKPRLPEGQEPEIPSDDDLSGYSEGVQKRIKRLTFAANEERRQREEAARMRDEAVLVAQRQKEELDRMRAQLQKGDETIISQAQQSLKVQMEQAQAKLRSAYEAGDADAVVEANTKLAQLAAEASRVANFRPRPAQPAQPPAPAATQPAKPSVPKPSPRAEQWAAQNSWFGNDTEMTALAFGVHERVIQQGVAPDSEEYYTQIDAAVRQRFPDKFASAQESAPRRQPGSVVAPGGRNTSTAPRKVTLTASQVALARRLGLTPAQYAAEYVAQMNKEQKNG